eukprot:c38677_g1_i1 orf=2-319(-)
MKLSLHIVVSLPPIMCDPYIEPSYLQPHQVSPIIHHTSWLIDLPHAPCNSQIRLENTQTIHFFHTSWLIDGAFCVCGKRMGSYPPFGHHVDGVSCKFMNEVKYISP